MQQDLSTQVSLDKHSHTQTSERPFCREFCEPSFMEQGSLLRHVASCHQEAPPHFCQIPGKTDLHSDAIVMCAHQLLGGVRKFECREGSRKFTQQAHLRRHMELYYLVEDDDSWQHSLSTRVTGDQKMVVVVSQLRAGLQVGSAKVIVMSLARNHVCRRPSKASRRHTTFAHYDSCLPEDCDT